MPNQDENTLTPAGGHEGGKPKNFRFLIAGLLVMFVLAGGITAASNGIFDRPGADQGAVRKAPAD